MTRCRPSPRPLCYLQAAIQELLAPKPATDLFAQYNIDPTANPLMTLQTLIPDASAEQLQAAMLRVSGNLQMEEVAGLADEAIGSGSDSMFYATMKNGRKIKFSWKSKQHSRKWVEDVDINYNLDEAFGPELEFADAAGMYGVGAAETMAPDDGHMPKRGWMSAHGLFHTAETARAAMDAHIADFEAALIAMKARRQELEIVYSKDKVDPRWAGKGARGDTELSPQALHVMEETRYVQETLGVALAGYSGAVWMPNLASLVASSRTRPFAHLKFQRMLLELDRILTHDEDTNGPLTDDRILGFLDQYKELYAEIKRAGLVGALLKQVRLSVIASCLRLHAARSPQAQQCAPFHLFLNCSTAAAGATRRKSRTTTTRPSSRRRFASRCVRREARTHSASPL